MRIGILTGGGDVPGLNPCIKSVTRQALAQVLGGASFRQTKTEANTPPREVHALNAAPAPIITTTSVER